jgi:nucleoside-diphosphate-sugar epimerase
VVLVNGGDGVSNATYVDDVVQGLLLGAVRPAAIGETFIIKGPGRVTRRQLFECYEKMLGFQSTVPMTLAEISRSQRQQRWQAMRRLLPELALAVGGSSGVRAAVRDLPVAPMLRTLWKKLQRREAGLAARPTGIAATHQAHGKMHVEVQGKALIFPPAFMVPYYAAQMEFSAKKAEKVLGFAPRYDLHSGMAMTAQWARWARLLS